MASRPERLKDYYCFHHKDGRWYTEDCEEKVYANSMLSIPIIIALTPFLTILMLAIGLEAAAFGVLFGFPVWAPLAVLAVRDITRLYYSYPED